MDFERFKNIVQYNIEHQSEMKEKVKDFRETVGITQERNLAFLQGEKESECITTYCSDRYALFPEMQSMTCEEMADKIIREDIVIYM